MTPLLVLLFLCCCCVSADEMAKTSQNPQNLDGVFPNGQRNLATVSTAATKAAFAEFLKSSTYDPTLAYGSGPGFSEVLLHKAQFKFALVPGNERFASFVRFAPIEEDQMACRMDGYLDYCDHPFAGDTSKSDIQAPYTMDFAIYDEPFFLATSPDIQNYPLFVMGLSTVFNIPGVEKLVLSKQVLAKIFRGCNPASSPQCLPGSITRWNDAAIKATNDVSIHSILDAVGPIQVIVQSDSDVSNAAVKRGLASFDEDFARQIGVDDTSIWNGTNHTKYHDSHGVLLGVRNTPGSISYATISLVAMQPGVKNVELLSGHSDNPVPVYPNTDSLYAAFQEIGLDFGNDGREQSKLTVELTGALGRRAWPFVSVGYLAVRTNATSDDHAACMAKRSALMQFFEYMYNSQGYGSDLFNEGFAPMTVQAAQTIIGLMRSQMRCNGELVYQVPPVAPKVTIQADDSLHEILQLLGSAFQTKRESRLMIEPLDSHISMKRAFSCLADTSCMDDGDFVVLADENLSSYIIRDDIQERSYTLFSMPYCAMATGFIHNFCSPEDDDCPYLYAEPLILDLETTASILDRNILRWDDAKIQRLNPDKLLPPFPIEVVSGPKTSNFHFDFIDNMRRSYHPGFSFRGGGNGLSTYIQAWLEVSLRANTIAFVPFNGTNVEGVQKVTLLSRQGVPVPPTTRSIEACARDTYDRAANVFFLSSSEQPDCYPLVQVFNIFMRDRIDNPTAARLTQYLYERSVRKNLKDETVISVSGMGTLSDVKLPDLSLAERNFVELESIIWANGSGSVLRVPHDLTLIPSALIICMYFLLGLELLLFVSLGVWVVVHRNRKLVRNSSPVFMMQVLVGSAIMACTVIPLAQQDGKNLVPRGMTLEQLAESNDFLDRACVTQPILFSLGFFIAFSALFLKSWRLIRIFNNKKLRNLFLRDRQLLMYQLMVIAVVVILNLIWAVQSPLVWQRFAVFTDSESGLVTTSYGICNSRQGIYPALPLLIGIMLVLVIGNYLAYLGRRIPTEFNESKWTAMTMVMTLEAFVIGLPILMLANSQPVPGFIIKAFSSLLVSGATVGLIFLPKVAMAYGWGVIEGESNPWRFVKGDSSGSGKPHNKSHSKEAGAACVSVNSKMKSVVQPSLNSLVEGKLTAVSVSGGINDSKILAHSAVNPFFRLPSHKNIPSSSPSPTGDRNSPRISKEFAGATPSEALAKVLHDDPMRRRFRRYLQTLRMEENVRFWDSIVIFRLETEEHRRYVSARAIIQTFVLDSSPLQVNLKSNTKSQILAPFSANDKQSLGSLDFFNAATNELFEDLRQSDAFRRFLENDTFSQDVLGSKSDPLVMIADANNNN